MKNSNLPFLHSRPLRHMGLAVGICVLGFFFTYLSGGMLSQPQDDTPVSSSPGTEESSPILEVETEGEESEAGTEGEEETPSEESVPTSAANYYVRLSRGLSSSEEELLLDAPSQLKAAVEYRGQNRSSTLTEDNEITQILDLLQKAKRLPDESEIVSVSSSRSVSLTLPYADGYGDLYIFEGYVDGAKKAVTLIQDNSNHLYQTKAAVASQLYDLLKPVETSLNAERLNVYSTRDYTKSILQAQSTNKEDFALIVDILNSLEKSGSSLDLDSPDYLITLLPSNSVAENDYCYLWLDEKELKVAFADDSITVYRSTDVTSSQMKKWIRENSVK
ncbi:MAG: hypothetical protein IJ411_01030 [Oscillospiraceae bacterium]|nr:hypothetical protein [Oscillospiraceae bacterium]